MSESERHIAKVRQFPVDRVKDPSHEVVNGAPIRWNPDEVTAILSGRLYTKTNKGGGIDECQILLREAAFILKDGEISVPSLTVRPADNFVRFTNGIGEVGTTGSFLSDVAWIGRSGDEEDEVCIHAENEQGKVDMYIARDGDFEIKSEVHSQTMSPSLQGRVLREVDRLGDKYLSGTESDSPNRTETGYNNVVPISVWQDKK